MATAGDMGLRLRQNWSRCGVTIAVRIAWGGAVVTSGLAQDGGVLKFAIWDLIQLQ